MVLSRRQLTLSGRRLLVAALCLVLVTPAIVLVPNPPAAEANVCDAPLIGTGCEVGSWVGSKVGGGEDLITDSAGVLTGAPGGLAGVIGGQVGKAVSKAIKSGTKGVFDQLTQWVGTAAGWLFLKVVTLISATTSPNLFHEAFLAKYRQILALAVVLTAGVVAMAVIEGGRRGDIGQLTSMLVGGLPTAVLGMVVGVAIIQLSLNLVDALSAGVAEATKSDIQKWFEAGAKWMVKGLEHQPAGLPTSGGNAKEAVTNSAAAATPGFVLFVSELLAVIGAFGLWIELLMRDAAIYVCALFLPLGLAASVWPRWSGVLRKTFEILICLIVSKFFLVMVISLAASFLGKPDGVESLLAGSAMMIVALLCPFMLLKVIPFMEGVMVTSGASGMSRSAISTGSQVSLMRYHMGNLGGGGGSSGAGSYGPFGPSGAAQGQTGAAGAGAGAGASAGAGAVAAPATAGASVAAAAAGQAAGAASRAGQAHAASPIDTAASSGSTPRPASTGEQQQAPARSSESVASPVADPARPRPAQPQSSSGALGREQTGQTGQTDAPWQPSSDPPSPPAKAPGPPAGGDSQASEASSPGPPVPDEPRPRRTGGA